MKIFNKIIAVCFAIVMMASAVPFCVNAQVAYDINKDTECDINDVTALQKHLVGLEVDIDKNKADVNNDGVLNIRDASALQIILIKTNTEDTTSEIPKETEDIGDLL